MYRQILAREPENAHALYLMGVLALNKNNKDAAMNYLKRSVAVNPSVPDYHYNLGLLFAGQGATSEAEEHFREATELRPDFVEAHNNLGNVLKEQEREEEAMRQYRRTLELNPSHAAAHNNLGVILQHNGNSDEAIAHYRKALEIDPTSADTHFNLANALRELGDFEQAIAVYRRAIARGAGFIEAFVNLGKTLKDRGNLAAAIEIYRQGCSIHPNSGHLHNNLGTALESLGELTEAVAHYHKAIQLDPTYVEAYYGLGNARMAGGELAEAITIYRQALELRSDAGAHSNLLFCMHYSPDFDTDALVAEGRRWQAQHAAPFRSEWQPHENERDPERRLRIGYVSADFRYHPVGWFMKPVFAHHDKEQFEITCYASVTSADELTGTFRARSDRWRSIFGMSDAELADQIRADEIDILVDLSGHTREHRLLAFARKPAPVQVTAGGHYNTTGMEAIDYLIADRFHAPDGTEPYFSEALVRLPHDYICYEPPPYAPTVTDLPALREGHITFGCYNNLAKVNAGVIAIWARILKALPSASLRLQTHQFNDAPTVHRYRALFADHDIASNRLTLAGGAPHPELLAAYGNIDIALDPFPYSGGLTTCEALWMGVPVVTLTGKTFCGRHSTSHLNNVGLPELVTETPDAYVAAALSLANDPDRLDALRRGLRDKMAKSPMCDAQRYTRELEEAYREMWRTYCDSDDA